MLSGVNALSRFLWPHSTERVCPLGRDVPRVPAPSPPPPATRDPPPRRSIPPTPYAPQRITRFPHNSASCAPSRTCPLPPSPKKPQALPPPDPFRGSPPAPPASGFLSSALPSGLQFPSALRRAPQECQQDTLVPAAKLSNVAVLTPQSSRLGLRESPTSGS